MIVIYFAIKKKVFKFSYNCHPIKQISPPMQSIFQVTSIIAKTFKMFFLNPLQWLIFLPGFYFGLEVAFLYSEITRSYVSCVFGVSKVNRTGFPNMVSKQGFQIGFPNRVSKKLNEVLTILRTIFGF